MAIQRYQSAVVTGASSGIGAAVVKMLRAHDVTVYAVARRQARLQELADETGCVALPIDLRDSDSLYSQLEQVQPDILVNNAGMGRGFDTLANVTREEIDEVIGTNVIAALHVVRAVLPGMIDRKRGHLVNVGSVAGLYPLFSSLYGSSKGAIHLLNQCLRLELKGSGVRATEICPARVQTEFFQTAFRDEKKGEDMYQGFQILQPEDIAASIEYAITAPERVNVSLIEVTSTEQHIGGLTTEAVAR